MKGSDRRNTASMKSTEGPGTGRFRAGLFDLGCVKRISENAEMTRYYEGEIIQRQNEISHSFYVVLKGQVRCYSHSNGSYVQIAVLKCGDFFGGKGLFDNSPNVTTIEAEDEVQCLIISRELFDKELRPIINQLQQANHLYDLFKNQF
ncbi:unnamed protein product [Adineta ricciae]|uniref:Cyclic nucleotide-binding domain-containing protein n=1 Tax=Adineta ricciae TaxID=249248 RepID=A0A815QW90_ADIRI|nr:unnamed protein product [Adineta ricciae]